MGILLRQMMEVGETYVFDKIKTKIWSPMIKKWISVMIECLQDCTACILMSFTSSFRFSSERFLNFSQRNILFACFEHIIHLEIRS